MARAKLTVTPLTPNGALDDPAGSDINSDGHYIQAAVPERTILRVTNSGTTGKVKVVAGEYPPALAAGQGDIEYEVENNKTAFLGPFESGRVLRGDGSIHIDVAAGFSGKITAFVVPVP